AQDGRCRDWRTTRLQGDSGRCRGYADGRGVAIACAGPWRGRNHPADADHGLECGAISDERVAPSALQPIPSAEDPPHDRQAQQKKQQRHSEAYVDAYIGSAVEAPSKSADQVDHGIEPADVPPDRRQDLDRVEAAT